MSTPTFIKVYGKDLKVGDRIAPWGGRTTTITGLFPYVGPLEFLWANCGGARTASFNNMHPKDEWQGSGMTIEPWGTYDLVPPA